MAANYRYDRDSLLGKLDGEGQGSQRKAVGWGAPPQETQETRGLDNHAVLHLQDQKMKEQDKLLDILGESIDRQKQLAIHIGNEVDEHIELLADLDHEVGKTHTRLSKATDAVSKIGRKSSAKCLWMIILVLFLVLIGVIVLSFLF